MFWLEFKETGSGCTFADRTRIKDDIDTMIKQYNFIKIVEFHSRISYKWIHGQVHLAIANGIVVG